MASQRHRVKDKDGTVGRAKGGEDTIKSKAVYLQTFAGWEEDQRRQFYQPDRSYNENENIGKRNC